MQLNMTGLYTKLYAITDHTPCDVDTPKRFGAYILDWVVGGIFTGLPAVLLYSGLTKKQDMFGGLYVFESLGYARSWACISFSSVSRILLWISVISASFSVRCADWKTMLNAIDLLPFSTCSPV